MEDTPAEENLKNKLGHIWENTEIFVTVIIFITLVTGGDDSGELCVVSGEGVFFLSQYTLEISDFYLLIDICYCPVLVLSLSSSCRNS